MRTKLGFLFILAMAGVFSAQTPPPAAVLLFHGGGWVTGSADWTFDEARRFAASGLAAVAIDYRLSAGKVTPIEFLKTRGFINQGS